MDHEEYKGMLAARALNALDAGEARAFEAHLHSCPECRSQLSAWEEATAVLAFAALEAKPSEPSAQLRVKILEAIHIEPIGLGRRGETAAAATQDQAGVSNVIAITQRRSWLTVPAWAALAASLVFVILSASVFVLWNQNRMARQELGLLAEQILITQQQLRSQQQALGILATPGTRMSELAGTKVMLDAHAMLAYDKSGRAILMAKGLPPPPAGKAYQLWFIASGRPMPGKTFTTDLSGAGMLNDQVPAEALNAPVFAITLEPQDGVREPTGAIYLSSGS